MALKNLSTADMARITSPWTVRPGQHKSRERRTLESLPEVQPLLPRLDEAHAEVEHILDETRDTTARLQAIADEQRKVDLRHDALVRGIHHILSGYIELTADPATEERLRALRALLFPDGITLIERPYAEEAAEARKISLRLDAESRALLEVIPLPGSHLGASVDEYLASARRLDELEGQRIAERHVAATENPQAVTEARNKWIRVVGSLTTTIELGSLGEETADELLAPLREAEQAAAKEGQAR